MNARAERLMGVVHDMPMADYQAVDAMSSTGLRLFARSPWHYRHRIEVEPTRPMLRGTLAHCAILEPDAMAARYVVVPEGAPKRPTAAQWNAKNPSPESRDAMAWWTCFKADAGARDVISRDDYSLVTLQLAAIKANPAIANLLREGEAEVSVFWIDKATGVYCKARPDWIAFGHSIPLDIKTCADESPVNFGRAAARMRYDLQAAHYSAGIEAAITNRPMDEAFHFAAITNKPPVLAVPYVLTPEVRSQGIDERREMLQRFAWCQREDQWPAYGDGVQLLDFPAYAKDGGEIEIEDLPEGA